MQIVNFENRICALSIMQFIYLLSVKFSECDTRMGGKKYTDKKIYNYKAVSKVRFSTFVLNMCFLYFKMSNLEDRLERERETQRKTQVTDTEIMCTDNQYNNQRNQRYYYR